MNKPERTIRKFNPGTFQSDQEVIEQFVVRNRELGTVLETLRGNIESPSCQHVLVIAPRGRGKTMLLARTAAEIRTNEALSNRLFPVRFMEESQEIFNMTDFWLETLFHLAREVSPIDSDLARQLRRTHAVLTGRWREGTLGETARAAVLEAADRLDRKLVLMVENLQSLTQDVDRDFGWKLREVLQSEPQIMLLGSATSRFRGLDDASHPFFELFRIVALEPLQTEQCRRLWQVVSGGTVSGREIRPLEILTGGSPRLLVIVAGFGRHRSLRQLMEELVTLIDDQTEYFRGHLITLAKTERRVYIAILDLWRPSKTGEIAARARMNVRTVSTMLGRLVNRGAVIVSGVGRRRLYSAAERLFCIYYKLRRERDRSAIIQDLIRFMAVFYTARARVQVDEIEGANSAFEEVVERFGDSEEVGLRWQTICIRMRALLIKGRPQAAVKAFSSAYETFALSDELMMREVLGLVSALVAAGAPEHDLVKILSSDRTKADALAPLVVALRQRAGEVVRAPAEILEVAADIRTHIDKASATGNSNTFRPGVEDEGGSFREG